MAFVGHAPVLALRVMQDMSYEAIAQTLNVPALERLLERVYSAGVDGVFMEVHDNPKEAKSDGANALDSRNLRGVLKELQAVKKAIETAHSTP